MADESTLSKSPRADALKAELLIEESKLRAELAPHREVYDKMMNDPKLLNCQKAIKDISARLAAVQNELAKMVRAGGSKGITIEPGIYNR